VFSLTPDPCAPFPCSLFPLFLSHDTFNATSRHAHPPRCHHRTQPQPPDRPGPKLRIVVVGYKETKSGITVDAYVRSEKVEWLRKQGYGVTPLENVEPHDRERVAEEQAAVKRRLKKGRYGDVIWSGGYLTADEVERALEIGEQNHAGYFERIPLPNLTWEKRQVHAVRIGKGDGKKRPAVCFLGAVHGREWGGPDILVYFAVRLLRAYRDKQGFRLGKHVVSPARVRPVGGDDGHRAPASGQSRRSPIQHGRAPVLAKEPAARAKGKGLPVHRGRSQ
jgi:hypothetical protein